MINYKDKELEADIMPIASQYDLFAVTVTLSPSFCKAKSHCEQYDQVIGHILKRIGNYTCIVHVNVATELTLNGNLHLHLQIKVNQKVYRNAFKRMMLEFFYSPIFGFLAVKPVTNSGWLSYMNKGQYYVEKYKYAFSDEIANKNK